VFFSFISWTVMCSVLKNAARFPLPQIISKTKVVTQKFLAWNGSEMTMTMTVTVKVKVKVKVKVTAKTRLITALTLCSIFHSIEKKTFPRPPYCYKKWIMNKIQWTQVFYKLGAFMNTRTVLAPQLKCLQVIGYFIRRQRHKVTGLQGHTHNSGY